MSRTEALAIHNIENTHCRKERLKRYVMLGNSEINWFWDDSEVREFDRLFKEGYDIKQLAKFFKRPQFEIVLMTIDRDLLGKLGDYDYDVDDDRFGD